LYVITIICGVLKAIHIRPSGYAFALNDLKAKDYISVTVVDPAADEQLCFHYYECFCDSGREFSAAWFLHSSRNVSSSKPSLPLPSKLLADGPFESFGTQ